MRSLLLVLAVAVVAAVLLILSRGEFGAAENSTARDPQAEEAAGVGVADLKGSDPGPFDLAVVEGVVERSEGGADVGDATATRNSAFPMAHLFGRAVDENGAPVAGAEIALDSMSTWREGVVMPTVERNGRTYSAWHVETAIDGRFSLDVPVPTDDWVILIIEGSPYVGLVVRDFGHAGGREKPPIVEGDNDLGVIMVPRTGAVTGAVRGVDGVPIEGATVTLDGRLPGGLMISTRTDALGHYLLGHVPPGPTWIDARHERFLIEGKAGPVVIAQQSLAGPSFALVSAPTIGGIVVDEDEAPLGGIRVWGRPSNPGRSTAATSDGTGRFLMYLPQDEAYVLRADRDPRFVPWGGRHGPDSTFQPGTMDIRIVLVRADLLEVHVVDASMGVPIECFSVDVIGENSNGPARLEEHSGGIVVVPASPSRNRLVVRSPGYAPLTLEAAFDKPPVDGEIGVQTVQLLRGASITGRVTLDGRPVPAAQVTLAPRTRQADRDFYLGTGADGIFQFECLPPGSYRLIAKGVGGSPRVVEKIVVQGQIGVALGDVELLPEAILIGKIWLAGGASAVGLEVTTDYPNYHESVVESADGTFTFRGLEPGEHSLSVKWDGRRIFHGVRREFTIAAGETKRLLIDLTDKAVFDFTVCVRSGGSPLAGIFVTLDDVEEREGRKYAAEGARIGPTDGEGVARGSVTAGQPIVAVVRDGHLDVGRSSVVVPRPGGVDGVTIDVSLGSLVLQLPEGVEMPDVGVLHVSLQPEEWQGDRPVDPLSGQEQFWTANSPRSKKGDRPWTDVRHEVGRVAVGRCRLTVSVQTLIGSTLVDLLEPYSTKIEIGEGESTEVQVSR